MIVQILVLAVVVIANLIIAAFSYFKNRHHATNILLAVTAIVMSVWSVANYLSLAQPNPELTIKYIRIVMLFAALINYSVFLLLKTFPRNVLGVKRGWFIAMTIFTGVVCILALSPFLFTGVTIQGSSIQPIPGPAIPVFLLHTVGLLGAGFFSIIRKFRHAKRIEKAQLRFLVYGLVATLSVIILSNFVGPVVFKSSALVSLGPSYTLIFIGSISYAILRHRLLNIRAIVARSVTYILLLGALAGGYSLSLVAISQTLLRDAPAEARDFASILLSVVLVLTFQPIRRLFERITDRLLYRDRYDSQQVTGSVTKILASELILDRLLGSSLQEICRAMRIQSGHFMVFDDDKIYKVVHYGPIPKKLIVVPELLQLNRELLIADEIEGKRKEIMEHHEIRVSVQLKTKDELIGYLLLGDKLSGDIYSNQDITVLEILAGELAVAIQNAKSYEEISRFNITLKEEVEEATANLRLANQHLKELDKAKDDFISMASHQLRTPLTTIKGYISMLQEGDAGPVPAGQKKYLEYAATGADRMVHLIGDLLNVSRMSAGRFLIERQPTDLRDIVDEELRNFHHRLDAKGLKIIYDRPSQLPKANIDETKTRQVVVNFIDNAIFYTKKGSITINLTHENGKIILTVTDTGIGVPSSEREKLFSKFFRAPNAQSVRPDGTGLGLYLAKRVIEDQNGKIIFESQENHGSTFGFEVPVK